MEARSPPSRFDSGGAVQQADPKFDGCAGDNVELLLEVEVTKSICAAMSREPRDRLGDRNGLVEVTIVRPHASELLLAPFDSAKRNRRRGRRRRPVDSRSKEDAAAAGAATRSYVPDFDSGPSRSAIDRKPYSVRSYARVSSERKEDEEEEEEDDDDLSTHRTRRGESPVVPRRFLFVELGAVCRVLDQLRSDRRESRGDCEEMVRRLQSAVDQWALCGDKFDDFLARDRSLTRCEYCGVISCAKSSRTSLRRPSTFAEQARTSKDESNYDASCSMRDSTRGRGCEKDGNKLSGLVRPRDDRNDDERPSRPASTPWRFSANVDPTAATNYGLVVEGAEIIRDRTGRLCRRDLEVFDSVVPSLAAAGQTGRLTPSDAVGSQQRAALSTATGKTRHEEEGAFESDADGKQRRRRRRRRRPQGAERHDGDGQTENEPHGQAAGSSRTNAKKWEATCETQSRLDDSTTASSLPSSPRKRRRSTVLPVEFIPFVDTVKCLTRRGGLAPIDAEEVVLPLWHDEASSNEDEPHARRRRRKQCFALRDGRDVEAQLGSGFWPWNDRRSPTADKMAGEERVLVSRERKCLDPYLVRKDRKEIERDAGSATASESRRVRYVRSKSTVVLSAANRVEGRSARLRESGRTTFGSSSTGNAALELTESAEERRISDRNGERSKENVVRKIRTQIAETIEKCAGYSIVSREKLYGGKGRSDGGTAVSVSRSTDRTNRTSTERYVQIPRWETCDRRRSAISEAKRTWTTLVHGLGPANEPFETAREVADAIWGEGAMASTGSARNDGSNVDRTKRSPAWQRYVIVSAPTTSVESHTKTVPRMTRGNPESSSSSSSSSSSPPPPPQSQSSSSSLLDSGEGGKARAYRSERFERKIIYDDDYDGENDVVASSLDVLGLDRAGKLTRRRCDTSDVLPIYRRILESNEEMDWDAFQQLVSTLHPSQRELWRDICKAVSNEARRIAGETGATTEVCIEINPERRKENGGRVKARGGEVSFEMDIALKEVESFLGKKLRRCTAIGGKSSHTRIRVDECEADLRSNRKLTTDARDGSRP